MNGREELTPGPVAEILGTSKATVQRMADRREIPSRRSPGGHRLIPREAVEAMKLRLENPRDPLGAGVADNGDRPAAGNVERRATDEEPSEASGLSREQVHQAALDSVVGMLPPTVYAWAGYPPYPRMTWTSLMAEQARREMLAWFADNYRESWTTSEVWDLAHELMLAYARKRAKTGAA
jgi:excisionase family DNA binding protein